jgi:hypothetical protein
MMSEIILHPGKSVDTELLASATFSEAGSNAGMLPAENPPVPHHMDQLLLVFKDGLRTQPIQGLEVRKAVAALIAADVRVDYLLPV